MGENACRTITELWNEEQAADACIHFYENWKKGIIDVPKEGPFSQAQVIPARFSYTEGTLE